MQWEKKKKGGGLKKNSMINEKKKMENKNKEERPFSVFSDDENVTRHFQNRIELFFFNEFGWKLKGLYSSVFK